MLLSNTLKLRETPESLNYFLCFVKNIMPLDNDQRDSKNVKDWTIRSQATLIYFGLNIKVEGSETIMGRLENFP